uniref:Uncharacterized protein n=1 Tax=Tulasnella barnavirus 1 TaxID=2768768 RepID=A0A7G9U7U7_9VIRU|nr:hypothetical protein [Tulasnella barnavirus 1]
MNGVQIASYRFQIGAPYPRDMCAPGDLEWVSGVGQVLPLPVGGNSYWHERGFHYMVAYRMLHLVDDGVSGPCFCYGEQRLVALSNNAFARYGKRQIGLKRFKFDMEFYGRFIAPNQRSRHLLSTEI